MMGGRIAILIITRCMFSSNVIDPLMLMYVCMHPCRILHRVVSIVRLPLLTSNLSPWTILNLVNGRTTSSISSAQNAATRSCLHVCLVTTPIEASRETGHFEEMMMMTSDSLSIKDTRTANLATCVCGCRNARNVRGAFGTGRELWRRLEGSGVGNVSLVPCVSQSSSTQPLRLI